MVAYLLIQTGAELEEVLEGDETILIENPKYAKAKFCFDLNSVESAYRKQIEKDKFISLTMVSGWEGDIYYTQDIWDKIERHFKMKDL